MDTSIVTSVSPNPQPAYIYALADPLTGLIRYVGKAVNVKRRFSRHKKDAADGVKDHKSRWIASVVKNGYFPVIYILEVCGDNWREREIWWIAKLRNDGLDLTNSTNGGDGLNPSEETRRKMRESSKGRPHRKRGVPSPLRGRTMTEEHKRKIGDAAKARYAAMTVEQRKDHTRPASLNPPMTRTGWHHTDEAKKKVSEAAKGHSRNIGYKKSKESIEKMLETRKRNREQNNK